MTYEVSIQGTAIEKVTEDQQAVLGGEQGAGTFSDQIFVKKMMWKKLTTPPEMFPYWLGSIIYNIICIYI